MPVLLAETVGGVAVLTLNRPEQRNALSSELLKALRDTVAAVDADDDVAAIVITGADPAFCAGLDLKELGSGESRLLSSATDEPGAPREPSAPWARTAKPIIGAINGPAITGGFEIALRCDFLVASERARFGDTHARVGILPGWGLSVLLPQAIGVRRAKEMSLSGNFLSADEALHFGLVNHVVPHGDLLPFTLGLAADIAGNDQSAVRALLAEYDAVTATTVDEGLRIEAERSRAWQRAGGGTDVEARRRAIIDRGRGQI